MMYSSPHAVFLHLSGNDVITASLNPITITTGDYSKDQDTITFEELISE